MDDVETRRLHLLASRMRRARDNDDAYTLLLGAGASLSSNVPTTDEIIDTLLTNYWQDVEGNNSNVNDVRSCRCRPVAGKVSIDCRETLITVLETEETLASAKDLRRYAAVLRQVPSFAADTQSAQLHQSKIP
jgi:hypothetical protein